MEPKQIIMSFTVPPSVDDLMALAGAILESLPEELSEYTKDLTIEVEDFPDEVTVQDCDIDDPYELVALYKNSNQISPGVEKKSTNGDDVLVLYRRPLLDMWCETIDDLANIMRQVMIEELGRQFDFPDQDIEDMIERHYQGLL